MKRFMMMLLVLSLIACPALAGAEGVLEEDAPVYDPLAEEASEYDPLAEEAAGDASGAEPGDYEWYLLPATPEEGHAYVDIYPENDTAYALDDPTVMGGKTWRFAFTLQETAGVVFKPTVLSIIYFAGEDEVRRDSFESDVLATWWKDGAALCSSSVVYEGTVNDSGLTAVAISVIGLDASGYEMEFHSVVNLEEAPTEGVG